MKEKVSTLYDNKTNSVKNSLFATLQDDFSRETHGVFTLGNPDKPSLSKVIAKIRKENGITDSTKKLKSGVRVSSINPRTGQIETAVYKVYELEELWANGDYTLSSWRSLLDFLMAYQQSYLDVADKVRMKQNAERDIQSPSTLEVYGETDSYRASKPKPILGRFIPVYKRQPTEVDKDFLYDNLRKDSDGSLYWKRSFCKEGESGYVLVDEKKPDFWMEFWKTNEEKIAWYLNAIPANLCKIRDERVDDGLPDKCVEDQLLAIFPMAFLAILHMQTVYSVMIDCETQKESLAFCRYDVGVYMGREKGMLCDTQSIKDALASNLFKGAYFNTNFVQTLQQASNAQGLAFSYIDLSGVDVSGRTGVQRAEASEDVPELPPKWSVFLKGINGNTPIFPIDTRMCELRLAYFVACVADASIPSIRQALYVFGDGECGKTTILEAISKIIGLDCCATLGGSPEDWVDSKTFSLINKVLAIIPEVAEEPHKIFESPFFKSATGGGTFQLRKLFGMANDYTPQHLLFAMSVNGKLSVSTDYVASRILPIAMTKNYMFSQMRSKRDLIADLLSERKEFLQWCFDTKAYYEHQKRGDGTPFSMSTPSGVLIVTDAQFKSLLRSSDPLTSDFVSSIRNEALQNVGQVPGCAYRHLTVYSQTEITKSLTEFRDLLIKKLFVFESEAILKNIDLNYRLVQALSDSSDPELSFLLKELGFKMTKDQSVLKGMPFKDLRASLLSKGVTAENPHGQRVYVGVRLRRKDEKIMLHFEGEEV